MLNTKMHLAGQICQICLACNQNSGELSNCPHSWQWSSLKATNCNQVTMHHSACLRRLLYFHPRGSLSSLHKTRKKQPAWQDQKDEQMLRIRSQIGYQHDPNLEKMQKKLRQTPCLVGFLAKGMKSFWENKC